jgi:hypothetical protein
MFPFHQWGLVADAAKVSIMFVNTAIWRDLISFRKDWARWAAGEKSAAKIFMFLTLVTTLGILGQVG